MIIHLVFKHMFQTFLFEGYSNYPKRIILYNLNYMSLANPVAIDVKTLMIDIEYSLEK